MGIKTTQEQQGIISYKGQRLVVKAYSGTGKTFVLVRYAEANPRLRMLYLAYNRAIRDEAARKFPKNVVCKTAHQLGFAEFGRQLSHKLTSNLRLGDVIQLMDKPNWNKARDVIDTLGAFMVSADPRILEHHFARANTGKPLSPIQQQYLSEIIDLAETLWRRMINPDDEFPAIHDAYLKLYQLSHPDLSTRYGAILFDEAQDASPVISGVVLQQQRIQLILVGDRHQQIYRFRGACNSLDDPLLTGADAAYLTNSFRFGKNVASVANALLALNGETRPVVGRGGPDTVVSKLPSDLNGPVAMIYRTVSGVIEAAITAAAARKSIFWVGGLNSYNLQSVEDIYWLSEGLTKNIKDTRIQKDFGTFEAYEEAAKRTKDAEMTRALKLLSKYDNIGQRIATLGACSVSDPAHADVIVTTAHKSKGLEFEVVQLGDDFPDLFDDDLPADQKQDEINLLYVASTRATTMLSINSAIRAVIQYTVARNTKASAPA